MVREIGIELIHLIYMLGVTSDHNAAQERYNLFMTPQGAIDDKITKVDNEVWRLYKIRLTIYLLPPFQNKCNSRTEHANQC